MKAIKKRSLFLITAASIIVLTATIISNLNPINAIYADNVSYGMTFNSSKNKLHNYSGATPYSGETTAKTNLDNNINFEYKDLMGLSNTWHVLKSGGYFTNLDPINGLEKININFKSDNVDYKIYWSNSTTFNDANIYTGTSSTSSPLNFNFNRCFPTYFKFENIGTGNLNIGEVNLKFACNELISDITVSSSDESLGTVTGGNKYVIGERVALTAIPNVGSKFNGWYENDALISSDNPYTFVAEYNRNIIAKFAVKTHEVKVDYDSSIGEVLGVGSYAVGDMVTLTAKAKEGYALDYWYDENLTELSRENTYSFKMPDNNVFLYATFTVGYTLSVTSEDDTKGVAFGDGQYRGGKEVTIEVDELVGKFKGWYNNNELVSNDNPYTFVMPSNDYELVAMFYTADELLGVKPVIDLSNKTITYGLYPQTNVNDALLISELDKLTTIESNGWYLYNGTYYTKTVANPYQSDYVFDNGDRIIEGQTYWFRCELIVWEILSNNNEEYYLLSDVLLDVHRYDDGSNNYADSEIRLWLNNEFYNSAFSLKNEYILTTEVDNSTSTTASNSNPYACENTFDKVFLPSYRDYINSEYGFPTSSSYNYESRQCKTTDWVRANHGYYDNKSYSFCGDYWTRSPYKWFSDDVEIVCDFGNVSTGFVFRSDCCVRPSISIKIA